MKSFFKIVSVVVLLVALVGAIVLVRNNQETRRGAAANDTFSTILPDTLTLNPGEEFNVSVWLNTGSNTDKMAGAEFRVNYDRTKLKYLGLEPQSGYTLINDPASVEVTDSVGNSYLDIRLLTMGTEMASAINVAKVKFQAVNNGEGSLLVQQGKIMISGQSSTWEIASNEPSSYKIGQVATATPTYEPFPTRPATITPIATVVPVGGCGWCGRECISNAIERLCIEVAPPEGMVCLESHGECVAVEEKVPVVTPKDTCENLWWFDDDNKECSMKQFCGLYVYQSLRTFPTQEECLVALPTRVPTRGITKTPMLTPSINCKNLWWFDETVKNCSLKSFCENYLYKSMRTYATREECLAAITPTRGVTVVPTRVVGPTIRPVGEGCGVRCTEKGGCGEGLVCAPIWWPCAQIPSFLIGKLQTDQALTQSDVTQMLQNCPDAKKILPTNYETLTEVKLPAFYGLCRLQTCVNCQCSSVTVVPTRRPTISVMPTVKPPQGESSSTSFWKKLFDSFFKNRQ